MTEGGRVKSALSTRDDVFQKVVASVDFEALLRAFHEQDQFVFVERFLPPELVLELVKEARTFTPHRAWVPWVRKAGAVGQVEIAGRAPLLHAFSRSPAMLDFAQRLGGVELEYKNERDAHAAALYYYERPGDHVGWHLDECGCEESASFTANFGLTNDTRSRAVYRVRDRELALSMVPGSLAFFCGSKPYHKVEPIGKGESRIAFSLTFVRRGKRVRGLKRFFLNAWDALAYFGPGAIFQRNGG
jgi:hypothetical protein